MSTLKKIAILGGTGFVGRELVTQLSKAGYQTVVPTRFREQHRELLLIPRVKLIQANIHNYSELVRSITGCDAVINLVGVLHDSKKPSLSFSGAHVKLAEAVIKACEQLNIQRYLHMSSLKAHPTDAPSKYLQSKGAAQQLVRASKLKTTLFQPSVIFGKNDSFIRRFAQLSKLPNPIFFLPTPNARFAPVHVADVCKAFVIALKDHNTIGQVYSCCGEKVYSMKELIMLIHAELGLKRWVIGLNDTLSRLTASILGIMPGKPFTKDNYLSMQVNSICKNNGLLTMGISPRSLESEIGLILKQHDSNQRFNTLRRSV